MFDYTALADMAGGITLAAADALTASKLGAPAVTITPHGRPKDDCGDFIGTWIEGGQPTFEEQWPNPVNEEIGFDCKRVQYVPALVLSLRRPCQPILTGNAAAPFPQPQAITQAGADLMVDFMVLVCEMPKRVQQVVSERQADLDPDVNIARVIPGAITPHDSGDIGGWDMRFRIELLCPCECEDCVEAAT